MYVVVYDIVVVVGKVMEIILMNIMGREMICFYENDVNCFL